MLKEGIVNRWSRFKLFFDSLKTEEERLVMAKEAFLFVIESYPVHVYPNKSAMLKKIVLSCPAVEQHISDEEMLKAFHALVQNAHKKKDVITPAEMEWVYWYNRGEEDMSVRYEIELLILEHLLRSSSSRDHIRQGHFWMVSEKDCLMLVHKILYDQSYKQARRKMELAMEFNLPAEEYKRAYLRILLRDRHLESARKIGVEDYPDIILDAIEKNVHGGRNDDALAILNEFLLPNKNELVREIEEIQAAIRPV